MAAHDAHKAPESSIQQVRRAQSGQHFVQKVDEQGQLKSKVQISSGPATPELAIAPTQPEAKPPAPKVSRVANAFPGGEAKFPNNPAVAAGFEAIFKGGKRARALIGGWEQNEGGRLHYTHPGKKTGRILVYPNLERNPAPPKTTTEALWEYVESLNPFTADVALAVLAQLCEPSVGDRPKFPMLQPVRITADAILRYKGIRRRGAERRVLLRKVHDEVERLRRLYIDVESFSVFNPPTQKFQEVSWEGDRLFDIVKVETIQETLRGETTDIEIAWLVRAGQWAFWWLSPQARVYIGKMARVLLELDHRENRRAAVLAKKVGLRVLFLYHALRKPNQLKLRIRNLIEDIGELPKHEARDLHWAGRTRDNFERAVAILGPGDGFTEGVNILGNVAWPEGCGPEDSDRTKGWTEKWLSAKLLITMATCPPVLSEDISRVETKDEGMGVRIRQARHNCERFWKQEDLAHHLNISRTCLSDIETNKRQPSEQLAFKMQKWAESRRGQSS